MILTEDWSSMGYDLEYNLKEDCLEFYRENAVAKLVGMLILTLGVMVVVGGGIDNNIGYILSGISLAVFGACLALVEDHIAIAFEEKAIFVDRRLYGRSIGFGSKTVPFAKIHSIAVLTFSSQRVNSEQEYAEIRFVAADGSISLPPVSIEEARKNYWQLIERTSLPVGQNPWKIE